MEETAFGAYNRINDVLIEYLGISVNDSLGKLENTAGETART